MSSKQCPKCRLYNPSEALRCDCGYDFASGAIRESYVLTDAIEKYGAEEALSQVGQRDVRGGIFTMLLAAGFAVVSVLVYASEGRLGIGIPTVPFLYGLFRFGRGMTARNRAKEALAEAQRALSESEESSERYRIRYPSSPTPSSGGTRPRRED